MPIDFKARANLNKGYADKLSSGTLEDLIRERAESPRRREYTIVVGEKVYHAAEIEDLAEKLGRAPDYQFSPGITLTHSPRSLSSHTGDIRIRAIPSYARKA
jgi:hypothetical protein